MKNCLNLACRDTSPAIYHNEIYSQDIACLISASNVWWRELHRRYLGHSKLKSERNKLFIVVRELCYNSKSTKTMSSVV